MMSTAILVLSRSGLDLAGRIRQARSDPGTCAIFGPSCVVDVCEGPPPGSLTPEGLPPGAFATGAPGVFGWRGPLRLFLPTVWERSEAIIAVMALGIIVRLVGPLAADKRRDPAVVAVDDAGRFAISVLGGHGADANGLARDVARMLDAVPVITTASDTYRLPAVDQIGRGLGWTIERPENLTRVAAAIVRRETVAVYQDAGPRDWWQRFGPWPAHFVRIEHPNDSLACEASALLVISDRLGLDDPLPDRTLIYRPRTLVAGIGCRRGTPQTTIDGWFEQVLARHGYAPASLMAVATVSLKADEPGLIAFAASRGVPLRTFPPEHLADVPGIVTPSARVLSKIGIAAVAEPAALRASGASRLLVPKQVGPGVTLALARGQQEPPSDGGLAESDPKDQNP